jgi:hypothetical protein
VPLCCEVRAISACPQKFLFLKAVEPSRLLVQPALQSRTLAYAFIQHWNGTLSSIEDKAMTAQQFSAARLQAALQMIGASMHRAPPPRATAAPAPPAPTFPRQAAPRPAAPRSDNTYTGAELRKGSVTLYNGPPPARGICRRWWYDGACAKGTTCYFAASHTQENAGRGDIPAA